MQSMDNNLTQRVWLCCYGDEISSASHIVVGIEEKWWRQHKIDFNLEVLLEYTVLRSMIQPLGLA
jgi:hypothetical protein